MPRIFWQVLGFQQARRCHHHCSPPAQILPRVLAQGAGHSGKIKASSRTGPGERATLLPGLCPHGAGVLADTPLHTVELPSGSQHRWKGTGLPIKLRKELAPAHWLRTAVTQSRARKPHPVAFSHNVPFQRNLPHFLFPHSEAA